MARAFARLLASQRKVFPFRVVAIQTLRHGSAFDQRGLLLNPRSALVSSRLKSFSIARGRKWWSSSPP
ncbi:MAG: hypothetical protein DMG59_20080 [Acidobacteria bacterium]|nr:MAG: hypothetical protein DMG59_20080 [Acidobacteriota bacterium]